MPAKPHQDILLMRWALFSVAGQSQLVAHYYQGHTPDWARELQAAMHGTVRLDEHTLLRSAPVQGGYVMWQTDIPSWWRIWSA